MTISVLALILVIIALVCGIGAGGYGARIPNDRPARQAIVLLGVGMVLLAIVHLLGAGPVFIR